MAPKKRQRATSDDEPVRLTRWLRIQSACVEGLEIRHSPGGLGLFVARVFAPDIIGGLLRQAILDPETVLATDPVAIRALKLGATEQSAAMRRAAELSSGW